MTYFLTSSPTTDRGGPLNPANGFAAELLRAVKPGAAGLFVASDPDNTERAERIAGELRASLEAAGLTLASFAILDRRTAGSAGALVRGADLILLSGGHVPTQNRFFAEIGLREALQGFGGVLLGISAGTMNSAETVYAQPELPGESTDPAYRRFLPGLGLTKRMILPHYQELKDEMLDGRRLFEDITYPDSAGREFFALPDGSYLYGRDGREEFRGPVWRIADGKISVFFRKNDLTSRR